MREVYSPRGKGFLSMLQKSKDFFGSSSTLAKPEPKKPQSKPQPTKEEIEKTLKDFFGF